MHDVASIVVEAAASVVTGEEVVSKVLPGGAPSSFSDSNAPLLNGSTDKEGHLRCS